MTFHRYLLSSLSGVFLVSSLLPLFRAPCLHFFSIFLWPILFLLIFHGLWWSAVVFAVYGGLCIPSIAPGCPIIAETNSMEVIRTPWPRTTGFQLIRPILGTLLRATGSVFPGSVASFLLFRAKCRWRFSSIFKIRPVDASKGGHHKAGVATLGTLLWPTGSLSVGSVTSFHLCRAKWRWRFSSIFKIRPDWPSRLDLVIRPHMVSAMGSWPLVVTQIGTSFWMSKTRKQSNLVEHK